MFNIPCVLLAPLLLGAACVTAQTYKATLVNFNDGIQCSTVGAIASGCPQLDSTITCTL